MRRRRALVGVMAASLLAMTATGLVAEETSSPPPPSPPPAGAHATIRFPPPSLQAEGADRAAAEPFVASLRSSLLRALTGAGFSVIADAPASAPFSAGDATAVRDADWALRCSLALVQGRLSYRIAVYELGTGDLVAADSFSAYAGPTAFPLIDDSAGRVATQLADYAMAGTDRPRRAVPYRITVLSPDEGATVSLGPPSERLSRTAGVIKDGKLELPYYPFVRGSAVDLFLSAPGRRTTRVRVMLGDGPAVVTVPPLEAESQQDFLAGTGTGRLLGATGGYRRYISPGWFFLFANDSIFAGYDFLPGSSPFLHEELWTGFGSFLVAPPESRLRFGAGIGLGYLLSVSTVSDAQQRVFFDLALLPVYLFAEYRLGEKTSLWLSLTAPYSLGTGSSGILDRGWMNDGTPSLSAGVVWRG